MRLDTALRKIRRDESGIGTVETGLREAKAVAVPVDQEGVKPTPSALAVVDFPTSAQDLALFAGLPYLVAAGPPALLVTPAEANPKANLRAVAVR